MTNVLLSPYFQKDGLNIHHIRAMISVVGILPHLSNKHPKTPQTRLFQYILGPCVLLDLPSISEPKHFMQGSNTVVAP